VRFLLDGTVGRDESKPEGRHQTGKTSPLNRSLNLSVSTLRGDRRIHDRLAAIGEWVEKGGECERRFRPSTPVAVIIAWALASSVIWAEEADHRFMILGPALAPDYWGSDRYSSVPFLVSQFALGGYATEIEGLSAKIRLADYSNKEPDRGAGKRPGWTAGLAAELDPGREVQQRSDPVSELDRISTAVSLGPYLGRESHSLVWPGDALDIRSTLVADVSDVYGGYFSNLAISYALPLMIPWRFELELETTYADASYMNTYFGVTRKEAERSGLRQFQPGASFRDISFNTNTALFFSRKTGLLMRTGLTRLVDQAADSPITHSGSATQYFIGLGFYYRFGG
jgi:outer membrane scaffolding protein for murein synthesis (MipA/OmpV family)